MHVQYFKKYSTPRLPGVPPGTQHPWGRRASSRGGGVPAAHGGCSLRRPPSPGTRSRPVPWTPLQGARGRWNHHLPPIPRVPLTLPVRGDREGGSRDALSRWEPVCGPFDAPRRGHSMSAAWCCPFGAIALRSNWYLELLVAALNPPSRPRDSLALHLAAEGRCDLVAHRVQTCCATPARRAVTARLTTPVLRGSLSCSLPCSGATRGVTASRLAGWRPCEVPATLGCRRALPLLGVALSLC